MKHPLMTALLAASALVPAAGTAQTAPSAADTAENAANEIIVTARKREENLQEVPIAITALGADTIQSARVEALADVAKLTPGLIYTPLFGKQNQLPIIRGVAQTLGQLNVGVFLDGVYLSGKASVDIELNDLARIEVIKGPQSALYGRNTFAGAINYVTQRPSREFSGRAEVTVGEEGLVKTIGRISGPLSDTLRASVGGFYKRFDGFYRSAIDGGRVDFEKNYGGSGTLEWQPDSALTVTLRGTYYRDKDGQPPSNVIRNNAGLGTPAGGSATQPRNLLYFGRLPSIPTNGVLVGTGGLNLLPGAAVTSTVNGVATPGATAQFGAINFFGDREEAFRTSATVDYDFGPVTGTSITSYAKRKFEFTYDGDNTICDRTTPLPASPPFAGSPAGGCPNFGFPFAPPIAVGANAFALSSSKGKFEDFSQELRFASSDAGRISYLFGLFYYRNVNDSIDRSIVPTQAAANGYFFPRQRVVTDSYSVFGSLGFKLTDALTITGELRYEYEKQAFTQSPTNPAGSGTLTPNVTGLFDLAQDFRFATPRLIVDYKLGRGNLIYASYARGAKTGGFNTGTNIFANQRTYQPEYSDNYELGVKTTLLGGRLRANAAGFYIDWKNQQVVDQNPVSVGGSSTNRSFTTNTAASEIYGIELDATFQPVPWFSVTANYAYTHPRYRKFVDATLAATFGTLGLAPLNFDNHTLPYVPKHKAVISPVVTLPFAGEDGSIEARVDVQYQSQTFLRADNLATFPRRTTVDLRLTGKYRQFFVQLFANNVTDTDTPVAGVRFFDSTNYSVSSPYVTGVPRRQLGATVGVKF